VDLLGLPGLSWAHRHAAGALREALVHAGLPVGSLASSDAWLVAGSSATAPHWAGCSWVGVTAGCVVGCGLVFPSNGLCVPRYV
jgi:hypothetical protein